MNVQSERGIEAPSTSDPAGAILDFARTHGVVNIIVGRSQQPWWKQVLSGSVVMRLLREGPEFDLHVIGLEPPLDNGEER